MDLMDLIKESRAETGMGSGSGRGKMLGGNSKSSSVSSTKSRVKVYDSIKDALRKGHFGQMFSTKSANRLYVITKRKWGKDKEQAVGDKVAKGFSGGSVPSDFRDVKQFAVRTLGRHGKQHNKKFSSKKYWKDGGQH